MWNQGGSGGDQSRPYPCPLELHSSGEAATKKLVDRGSEQLQAVLRAVGGRSGAGSGQKIHLKTRKQLEGAGWRVIFPAARANCAKALWQAESAEQEEPETA